MYGMNGRAGLPAGRARLLSRGNIGNAAPLRSSDHLPCIGHTGLGADREGMSVSQGRDRPVVPL